MPAPGWRPASASVLCRDGKEATGDFRPTWPNRATLAQLPGTRSTCNECVRSSGTAASIP